MTINHIGQILYPPPGTVGKRSALNLCDSVKCSTVSCKHLQVLARDKQNLMREFDSRPAGLELRPKKPAIQFSIFFDICYKISKLGQTSVADPCIFWSAQAPGF